MDEQALHISSVNRVKIGRNKPEDFIIAIDKLSMTFSWHNIKYIWYNQIKYSNDNGTTWETILFVDGMYSYDDINDYIQAAVLQNGDDKEGLSLTFVLSSYRVVTVLKKKFQLDFRNTKLIGFDAKLIKITEYNEKLPNITNSVDALEIGCRWKKK